MEVKVLSSERGKLRERRDRELNVDRAGQNRQTVEPKASDFNDTTS